MMDYLYISGLGITRGAILLPLEHPLDYLKTQIQSQSYTGSAYKFTLNHIKQNGFMKLYSGYIPNLLRTCFKQAYRIPLMIGIPNLYRNLTKNENFIQTSTGLTIAVVETYIICPLERVKVWLMTAQKPTLRLYFEQNLTIKEFTKGANALLIKQTLS